MRLETSLHYLTSDARAAIISLFANALLILMAWKLARAMFVDQGAAATALSATLMSVAMVVLVSTTLGLCGALRSMWLISVVSVFSAVGIWRRSGVAGGSAANRSINRERTYAIAAVIWFIPLAFLLGHIAVNGLLAFPVEWDGLAYHIPLIGHWIQSQSLYAPDDAWWWTPATAELVGLWMVAPFSGDFLAPLANLPFIALWALATLEIARLAGLSTVWRHLAVVAMLAVFTTFHEAEKAMNDLAVAASFFAAVAYGLRYFESQRRADLALAGVASGLLAGVKYFALGYAALVGATIVSGTTLLGGWREALRAGAILALAALPFAGYWYARNYWVTGHPLYPQGADALGIGYPHLWQTTLAGNGRPEVLPLAAGALWRMTGPCHAVAVVFAPLSGAALTVAAVRCLRRSKQSSAAVCMALAALLAGSAAVFAVTPFCVEDQPGSLNHLRWAYTPARYGLCFLSVAMLSFVWLLQESSQRLASFTTRRLGASIGCRRAIVCCCLALFAAALIWQIYNLIAYIHSRHDSPESVDLRGAALLGLDLAGGGWLAFELWVAAARHRRAMAAVGAAVIVVGASAGAAALSRRWHEGYARHFDALRVTTVFAHLAKAPPQTIAVLDHRPYPFFGSARQHRVCSPRILTTYEALTAFLDARRPDLVASPRRSTRQAFDRYKQGPEWLEEHESRFKPVVRSGEFALFSIVNSENLARPTSAAKQNATTN